MDLVEIVEVLVNRYTLSDLEDRLSIDLSDLNYGLEDFALIFQDDLEEMFREDGWLD